MVEFFKSRGCEVKIVCFLRSPIDYVKSALQQRIKGGLKDVPYINPKYELRLRTFSHLLPAENLLVRDFAEVINEYGDVVSGFASFCGLEKERIDLIRMNESLSATATRLLYRLNKLPVATFGTQDRVSARRKLTKILAMAFPASSNDKLDGDILSGLLSPDFDDERKFILEKFLIDFDKVTHSSGLEAVEAYLSDLSSFNLQHLVEVLKEHQVQVRPSDSIDEMLTALYYRIFYGAPLLDSDATYLQNIAVRIERENKLKLNDAMLLMSLAHRARPDGPFIAIKVDEYAAKLKG